MFAGRKVAPAAVHASPGTLSGLGEIVRHQGRRPLIVHGDRGLKAVESQVRASLEQAGLPSSLVKHSGYCSEAAVTRLRVEAERGGADVLVGIGGGRVLDTVKAAAHHAGLPCLTVPTSPATCAAITALSVYYDEEGAWLRGERLDSCPAGVLLDSDLLAAAPARLLAAGIADALAKYYEVGLAVSRSRAIDACTLSALALCRELKSLLEDRGEEAVEQARRSEPGNACRLVAEAAVLMPGLIAGLAGEANNTAAAHAVHNAFTRVSASRSFLHGELVAYGIVVQLLLEERPGGEIREVAQFLARLGLPLTAKATRSDARGSERPAEVLDRVVAAEPFARAFPLVSIETLSSTLGRVDAICSAVMRDQSRAHPQ